MDLDKVSKAAGLFKRKEDLEANLAYLNREGGIYSVGVRQEGTSWLAEISLTLDKLGIDPEEFKAYVVGKTSETLRDIDYQIEQL